MKEREGEWGKEREREREREREEEREKKERKKGAGGRAANCMQFGVPIVPKSWPHYLTFLGYPKVHGLLNASLFFWRGALKNENNYLKELTPRFFIRTACAVLKPLSQIRPLNFIN